jgi:hypothetical protein
MRPGDDPANPVVLVPGYHFSGAELQAMALDGVLVRIHGQAYAPTTQKCSPAVRARAAALTLPAPFVERVVLGRLTAAWVHGCAPDPELLSLLVDWRRRTTALPPWSGCILHEVALGPHDVVPVAGVPVTSALRTAYDVALQVPQAQALPVLAALFREALPGEALQLVRQAVAAGHRLPHKAAALATLDVLDRSGPAL